MKATLKNIFIVAIMCLSAAGWATGQQYINQQGRILDANPRIGSYGYNTTVPLDTLIPSGNLYITGNVSGGMRFQGVVPYRSSYEFGADTGSGLLSDFRRDSYGLDRPGYGMTAPYAYMDPSRSVTTTYGGQVINSAQAMNALVTPVGAAWRTPGSVTAYQRDEMMVRPYSQGFSPLSTGKISPAAQAGSLPMLYTPTQPHSLLAPEAAKDLSASMQRPLAAPRSQEESSGQTSLSPQTPLQETAAAELPAGEEPVDEHADFFPLHLLEALRQAAAVSEPAPQEEQPESLGLAGPGLITPTRTTPAPIISTSPAGSAPTSADLSALSRGQALKYLRQGKAFLAKGEFYRAADQFNLAAMYAPRDPGIYLARCHALLGAGEFLSAAFYLSKALTTSGTALDAAVITLPDGQILQERLAEVKRWREQHDEPMLMFIQGYVEACLQQTDAARQTLAQAAEKLPSEPAIGRLLSSLSPAKETTP